MVEPATRITRNSAAVISFSRFAGRPAVMAQLDAGLVDDAAHDGGSGALHKAQPAEKGAADNYRCQAENHLAGAMVAEKERCS